MRVAIIAVLFAIGVSDNPFAWAAPQASVVPVANGVPGYKFNRTRQGNHTHNLHKEATPTFKQGCDCATPIVPVNLLSLNEVSWSWWFILEERQSIGDAA